MWQKEKEKRKVTYTITDKKDNEKMLVMEWETNMTILDFNFIVKACVVYSIYILQVNNKKEISFWEIFQKSLEDYEPKYTDSLAIEYFDENFNLHHEEDIKVPSTVSEMFN